MFTINAKTLGIAGGVLWAVMILLITWASLFNGYGYVYLSILADIFPGFSVSFIGSLIGAVYGFVTGFIFYYLLATLYNFIEH